VGWYEVDDVVHSRLLTDRSSAHFPNCKILSSLDAISCNLDLFMDSVLANRFAYMVDAYSGSCCVDLFYIDSTRYSTSYMYLLR
jgi:hypothetical protein